MLTEILCSYMLYVLQVIKSLSSVAEGKDEEEESTTSTSVEQYPFGDAPTEDEVHK